MDLTTKQNNQLNKTKNKNKEKINKNQNKKQEEHWFTFITGRHSFHHTNVSYSPLTLKAYEVSEIMSVRLFLGKAVSFNYMQCTIMSGYVTITQSLNSICEEIQKNKKTKNIHYLSYCNATVMFKQASQWSLSLRKTKINRYHNNLSSILSNWVFWG